MQCGLDVPMVSTIPFLDYQVPLDVTSKAMMNCQDTYGIMSAGQNCVPTVNIRTLGTFPPCLHSLPPLSLLRGVSCILALPSMMLTNLLLSYGLPTLRGYLFTLLRSNSNPSKGSLPQ